MSEVYNPTTISRADLDAVLRRIERYVRRHGSEYGENPCADPEDAAQQIVFEWQTADWTELEWLHLQRNGRTIVGPGLSELGRHLRAALFHAGRHRRRRWHADGASQNHARAESRRRDFDDSTGSGMGSRSADPALIALAVESAQREGFRTTPDRFRRRRLRWLKTRNSTGSYIEVIRRETDRTVIEFRAFTRFNFRRAGDMPNRAMPKTIRRLPGGWSADDLREAVGG